MNLSNLKFVDKYNKRQFGNVSDNINPDDKLTDASWYKKKGEYLFSMWLLGDSYIPASTSQEMANLRAYAQGRQPTTKYMNILDPLDPKTGERTGFYNISWDNVPIYTKYREKVLGTLRKFDYAVSVQCLDEGSEYEKRLMKYKMWVQIKEADFINGIKELAGIQDDEMQQEQLPIMPRSFEEMEMLAAMGSFRLAVEIALEKYLYKSAKLSEWEEIRNRMDEDAVDIGTIASQDYTDPVSGIPMSRYVDPEYLIVGSTRDNAFTEISDIAEIRFMTMAQLKDMGMTDDEINRATKAYAGSLGNPAWNQLYQNGQYNYQTLSLFRVPVLDMDFESFNTYNFEYRTLRNGQEKAFKLPFDADKSKQNRGNRYETNQYARRYKAKWIIGTDIVKDYGFQYNQVFNAQNRPKCSYSVYRITDRSLTSRCVSTIDDIQIAILKFRNAWAKAAPAGLQVEWGSLSNMKMGGKEIGPMDILKIYRTTGDLVWKAQMDANGRPIYNQMAPVDQIPGGLGPILGEFQSTLNMGMGMLAELTAIGRGQDGTMPSGDGLVGVAKIAEASMMDTLRPILSGVKRVKNRVFNNLCLRWQLRTASGDINEMVETDGGIAEIVRLSFGDIGKKVISTNCEMLIDDTQREIILGVANDSLKANKQGQAGISFGDFMFVLQCLERGQLKYAQMWIMYREEQAKKEAQQLQQENMQMNGENMQMQEEAKRQTEAMLTEAKALLEQLKGEISIEQIREKGREERWTLLYNFHLENGKQSMKIDAPTSPSSSGQPSQTPSQPSSPPLSQGTYSPTPDPQLQAQELPMIPQ